MKAIVIISAIIIACAASWATCVGALYLICLCFSWHFSFIHATGVWIILLIIKSLFPYSNKK